MVAFKLSHLVSAWSGLSEIDSRMAQLGDELKAAEAEQQLVSTRSRLKVAVAELGEAKTLYRRQRVAIDTFLTRELGEQEVKSKVDD